MHLSSVSFKFFCVTIFTLSVINRAGKNRFMSVTVHSQLLKDTLKLTLSMHQPLLFCDCMWGSLLQIRLSVYKFDCFSYHLKTIAIYFTHKNRELQVRLGKPFMGIDHDVVTVLFIGQKQASYQIILSSCAFIEDSQQDRKPENFMKLNNEM